MPPINRVPPGKEGVFIGVPIKYPDDYMEETKGFLDLLLRENENPKCPYFYILSECVGINAPYATSSLANDFVGRGDCEWFLLWADDLVSTTYEFRLLLDIANKESYDIISGVVVKKPSAGPDFQWTAICGNFSDDSPNCQTVDLCRRGLDLPDLDVITGAIKQYDLVGGGCAFFRKKVIESLKPEDNGGLAYWCYDKQAPAYDIRLFQRLKEKGFVAHQHSGVLWGHIQLNEGVERAYTFWDLPLYRDIPGVPDRMEELWLPA